MIKHGDWKCKKCKKNLCSRSIGRKDRKVSGFCHSCYLKGENNHAYNGGKPKCKDCGKRLTVYGRFRCKKCFIKFYKGENTIWWKGGLPKCKKCGKKLPNRYATFCKKHRIYKKKDSIKCIICNKKLERSAERNKTIYCKKCVFKGERSVNWKGGITPINFKIRNSLKYKKWRTKVFTRDNYTCINCKKVGGRLVADHIKPFCIYKELRFAIDNGRTLCIDCDKKLGWKPY